MLLVLMIALHGGPVKIDMVFQKCIHKKSMTFHIPRFHREA